MSDPISSTPIARPAALRRRLGLAAVALVPLAFAGLFVGALGGVDDRIERIPAAIVNDDRLVTQTADDGTETPILAGRQLVTELTGDGNTGFDWQVTNGADAADKLADGEVYAVLTVPASFSSSIVSLQGDAPQRASFRIDTDDAHSYVGTAVSQLVAQTLTAEFGTAVTEQYLAGILGGFDDVAESLGQAADGATDLADGSDELTDGLDSLAGGTSTAASGARGYVDGVSSYTDGVGGLSDGLQRLAAGDDALDDLASGVGEYTEGVASTSAGLDQLNDVIQAYPTVDARTKAAMQQLTDGLGTLADSGPALAAGTTEGVDGIQSGVAQSAAGARRLDAASAELASGGASLAGGLDELAEGARASAEGSGRLAAGTRELAEGLRTGAEQVPRYSDDEAADAAAVIAEPVGFETRTHHAVADIGQGIATLVVPLGLWVGALAVFLVMRPVTRAALASTASNRRLVTAGIARASAVTLAQAVLLVLLLHVVLGVPWAQLPATLGFSLLMALVFTAVHHLLTMWLGRGGLVLSLVLLAVQLASTGGIYPIDLVAPPFQAVSPFLPLTHAVAGVQAIVSGGDGLLGASVALLAVGIVSVLAALVVIRRARRTAVLSVATASRAS